MYGYLIYAPCDGFGNDVYVAEPKVFTSFEEACKTATKWNKAEKKCTLPPEDEWQDIYEKSVKENFEDIYYVECCTPVRIKIE